MNAFSHLECSTCGDVHDPDVPQTYCKKCVSPLLARYDLPAAAAHLVRAEMARRPHGMWRWHELLPVRNPANRVTLGEGDAPLLALPRLGASLGLEQLFVKDESANPTGSFKARGLAAAVSRAKELGIARVIIPTAGNAGGAMAAYAARAGLEAFIYMPADTPRANVIESQITGARVEMVDGLISDAAALAAARSMEEGWFDLSTFKEPYRVEGKKVMGYELAESFGWSLPEVILYPTGGGTGLIGMWKAFAELEAMGWLEGDVRPRMVAVQSEGCAPVVRAFHEGREDCEAWPDAKTIASGLRVPRSFAGRLILADLRASRGTAVAVPDEEILAAQKALASAEGIFSAPEGAATFAALRRLIREGWLSGEERIVCFNTGAGVKYI